MTNQEAIRLIRNLPTMCEFTDAYGDPIDSDAYYEAVDMAISALQAQELSETQYEDGSRRLWISATIPPKVSGKYLVTHGGSYILSLDTYTATEDAVRIFDEGYEDYVGWQSQNVIAWMPLPEPYRAERRTDDKA